MDVQFHCGFCNWSPSKIDDYGKCAWDNPFAVIDDNIPQLPDKLFSLIGNTTPLLEPQSPTPLT